jgi:multidrug efflux pump subunit AcrA (membrane-fusion protein)
VPLAAEIDGRIVAMPMREGQLVRPGDPLFRLDQLQQQASVVAAAQAREDRLEAERYIFLNEQGAASTKQRDTMVTAAITSAEQAQEHIREAWVGTSWIVEMTATGSRDGKPFQAQHLFLTRRRTTPEALLQLVRDRWSIEGWHWIRDTQLHEDAHRFRGNGAGALATLRMAALNLLRLAGYQSIRAGMQAVMHDITALLAMVKRQPQPSPC